MDDDGYGTQQRRMVYQSDGRAGSRGEPGGSGAQRVRILVPTQSSSAYGDYPQAEDASGPQVIRILPRAVYNLKHDPAAAANRRGSVDTGLSHVIRVGRNDAPQVLRVGQGYPTDGYDTSPRVIRIGQGYNPEMAPQVIRIGPSGRIVTGATGAPQPSQYFTQRPQDFDASRHAVRDPSGTYSPPTMRVFASGTPYSYQASSQGSESPRIIAISSSQPYPSFSSASPSSPSTGQPPNLRYVMRPRPEGGEAEASSEWQGQQQQNQYPSQKTFVQSPTVVYSSHPGYRTLATIPRTASVDQGSTGGWIPQGNGVTEGQAEARGQATPRMFLRDAGRSDSREMFIMGANPVSIQMGGGSGPVGTRRGSLGVVQVIPMRMGQMQQQHPQHYQQPQQQQYVQQQQQQQQQHQQQQQPFVYTTSIQQEPPRSSQEVPRVIRGRVITSGGSDKMGEFDKIIADSIQQFLIQRQQQQQQQQQQYQGHVARPSVSPATSRPSNIEISEVHYPCGGSDQPSQGFQDATGSGPPDDRNIFNKYKFKFDSIGNLSRSNSRDDGAPTGGETDTGSWSQSRNAPIAIFRFNDFDDMVARMMELRQANEVGVVDSRQPPIAAGDGSRTQQIPQQQMATAYGGVIRKDGPDASGVYPPGQQPPWSRGQQGQRVKANMSREILRHKIEVFNNNAQGLIMSLEQDSETFHGFIRVQMNLIRPVEMAVPAQPPTLYDVLKQDAASSQASPPASPSASPASPPASATTDDSQTTFFYLPKDTTKVIHINSDTTTKEVIRSLLSKFKIKDNPLKFALYHKEGSDDKTASMRRLNDEELPLPMCLSWTDEGMEGLAKNKFVLQENDTGEILWDAFSLPELESFLMILNREEEEYIKEMKSTYRLLKIQLQKRFKELKRDRMQQDNNNSQDEHL